MQAGNEGSIPSFSTKIWEYSTSASAVGFQPKEPGSTPGIPTKVEEYMMKNKVKGKVLKGIRGTLEDSNFIKFEDAMNFKRIVEDFDEYMNNTLVMVELRDMSAKDVIRIVREIWEEVKGGF